MALLDAELQRIRVELGVPALEVGAEPYVGIAAFFSNVLQTYLSAGATTTSTTSVAASTTPALTGLTLASATGFAAQCTMVVDVDDRQERVTCESVSGSIVYALLSNAHSGTYPVTVEGGESIVRDILRNIRESAEKIRTSSGRAGIKKVDEIEFFEGKTGLSSAMSAHVAEREYWRGELARAIGWGAFQEGKRGGGGVCENY